jgi:hypothetical protein
VRRVLGRIASFVGRTIGLALVWVVVTALAILGAEQIFPGTVARYIGWGTGLLAVAWMWRFWRRRGREIAAEEVAAGTELHRVDPSAYWELLRDATDPLAFSEPDRYVGRIHTAVPEAQYWPWRPASETQAAAVEQLTEELERATLVRTVDGDAAEVLGIKDDVAYRYLVDLAGDVTFLSKDESKMRMLRTIRRVAGTGILLFMGSFVPLLIWHRDGGIPGWLVPIMIVGFVMAFFGVAASTGPHHFLGIGERWDQEGSGWDSGD